MPDRRAHRAPYAESQAPPARRWRSLLAALLVALAAGASVAVLMAGSDERTTAAAAEAPSGESLIRSVQRRLGVTVDGIFGPQTRAAVRAFQEGRGLAPTGALDDDTLLALGLIAQESLQVLTTSVASSAATRGAVAEQASVPPDEQAPSAETTTTPTATTPTTTATTPTTPTTTTTTTTTPDDDPDGRAAPVAGGALAGVAPPVVGGQIPQDAGLSPTPPRTSRRPGSRRPADPTGTGGLSPTPPATSAPAPVSDPIEPSIRAKLERIARCESGGNPRAVSANGLYRGKYQFDRRTWRTVGGTGDPAAAPEAEQDMRAAILFRRRGAQPWPICGRM